MKKVNYIASFMCIGALLTGQGLSKPPSPTLFCDTFPAKGSHTLILPIATWGRYSIRSSGDQPVAFSIADRRGGVLLRDGAPGERHGRIDLFLEIGDYKIAAQGPKNATADAVIIAEPFRYPEGCKPAYLLPFKENRLELHDLEQCAFWFEAPKDTTVYIEASGRFLGDLRLWQDGAWLVKSHNNTFVARPKAETPLSGIILTARVAKGWYMAAAYGGKGKDWSVKSGDAPLYLQSGLETFDANISTVMSIPAKGYVRFLLSNRVTAVVVEEPQRAPLYVEAGGSIDSICAKSSRPRLALSCAGGGSVRISGAPGQAFTLQTIGGCIGEIQGNGGAWWISSIHSGNHSDGLGASGFIVESDYDSIHGISRNPRIAAVSADTLSGDREIARRFNVLSENGLTSYVWVDAEGSYRVSPGGSGFRWRLSPYFITPPQDFKPPDLQEAAAAVSLNRGLHVLELFPGKKGIASIVIQKTSLLGNVLKAGKEAMLGQDGNRVWMSGRPSIQLTSFPAAAGRRYSIHLNSQDPEISSLFARPLPIDPDTALGIWSRPGENLRIPVRLIGRRALRLVDSRGTPSPFSLSGRQYAGSALVDSGAYTLDIPEGGKEPRLLLLASGRPELAPAAPPPPFPDEKRLSLPSFPALAPEKAVFLDLNRAASVPYSLTIDEPGIYRIETTGRLLTRLSLHDRLYNFVRNAEGNGIGRNAMLIEYLLRGSYRIDAGAIGNSAGHCGLAAARCPLVEGGALVPSIDNPVMVPAYAGVSYSIRIPAQGPYRVESIGQRGNFPFRFEDKNGWPFEPAVSSRELSVSLDKGDYRLISLPAMQEGRRIARLTRGTERRSLKGKGPHPLDLNEPLSLVWEESPDTLPATFVFSLVSPVTAALSATDGFAAALYQKGVDSAVARWSSKKRLELAAGDYRLCLKPRKKSNHAPYQVSVATRDLIPGLSYTLTKPQTMRVSVGGGGVAQIGSQGMLDVIATLFESDAKTVIAKSDDGFLDWNFAISRVLKPGRYFLRVESVEPGFSSTTVFMRALTDTLMNALSCAGEEPLQVRCELSQRLAIFPVAAADTGDILACGLKCRSRCGLAVEKRPAGRGDWSPVAQEVGDAPMISVPKDQKSVYRIKIWSEAAGEEFFELSYFSAKASPATWRDASGGLSGRAVAVGSGSCGWFKLDLSAPEAKAPGHFRAHSGKNQLIAVGVSTAFDTCFADESPSAFPAMQPYVWVEFHCEQPGRFTARLEPLPLEKQERIVTSFIGNRPRVFTAKQSGKSALFFWVESDGGHPLAGVAQQSGAALPPLSVRGIPVRQEMWTSRDRSANVVLPGEETRAIIWNALPSVDQTRPPATIACAELPLKDGGALSIGVSSWTSEAPGSRVIHHAKSDGPVSLRVTLPPRAAALVTRLDGTRRLECSFDEEPDVREFFTDGGDLFLFAPAPGLRFDVTAFSADSDAYGGRWLAPEKTWQIKVQRNTTVLLPLGRDMKKSGRLFYHGAVHSLAWIDAAGGLHADLSDGESVGPGGFLSIDAGEGPLKLDLCEEATPEGIMACKWGASLSPQGPVSIDRSSIVRLGDRVTWFAFRLADTQHVNFGAPHPLAAVLLRDKKPINYQEAWERFNWDLPLTPGNYFLGIHPIAGSSLEGGRLSVLYRPIERMSEKQPFTCSLAPGESRLVRFDVQKKDRFGIGVRMVKEAAQVCLYDSRGGVAARGRQQFVELSKGIYYLWMQVPSGAEGTSLTACLFGQEPPPNEPPEKLVKWIINGAQGPRPDFAAAVPDEEDDAEKRRRPPEETGSDQDGEQTGERYAPPENPEAGESEAPAPSEAPEEYGD
jgi:hypothetical protein